MRSFSSLLRHCGLAPGRKCPTQGLTGRDLGEPRNSGETCLADRAFEVGGYRDILFG